MAKREVYYSRLGRRIRALRAEAGLSQAQLGAKMGWTRAQVSLVEQGQSRVFAHQLWMLSRALRCEAEVLL